MKKKHEETVDNDQVENEEVSEASDEISEK